MPSHVRLGQKRTSGVKSILSALPPKADIRANGWACPLSANSCREQMQQIASLFDNLIGSHQ
jgi:hypothetical protein